MRNKVTEKHSLPAGKDHIYKRTFSAFDGTASGSKLTALMMGLIEQQESSWPQLAGAIDALENVRIRKLSFCGSSIKLQFNPARIVSTGASIDSRSIEERPCFLCPHNLPELQRGILYHRQFMILCNPYPIVRRHFTLSHVDHIPQSFLSGIDFFLKFAADLSPYYNVFYNGPYAGASAPDHLHFQVLPSDILPIEEELRESRNHCFLKSRNGISIWTADIPERRIILIEGKSTDGLAAALTTVMDRLISAVKAVDEPIMNVLCSYREQTWKLVMFFRRKHRPDVYYLHGKEQILVSPGLLEMGGLVITPVEKDFLTLDEKLIRHIYNDVSLDKEIFVKAINTL
jgi:hypothetical protein